MLPPIFRSAGNRPLFSHSSGVMVCRAIAAAAPVHRAGGFHRALPPGCSPELPRGALPAIAELTQQVLGAGGMDDDGGWAFAATDLLLEAWSALLIEATICCSPRSGHML